MILNYTLQISEILLALSVLVGLFRLIKGPTIVDRIIAFDLVGFAPPCRKTPAGN